jgi:hypothetical protein
LGPPKIAAKLLFFFTRPASDEPDAESAEQRPNVVGVSATNSALFREMHGTNPASPCSSLPFFFAVALQPDFRTVRLVQKPAMFYHIATDEIWFFLFSLNLEREKKKKEKTVVQTKFYEHHCVSTDQLFPDGLCRYHSFLLCLRVNNLCWFSS